MSTGIVRDQNLEKHIHKQMGCMAGFLQIFDRHQILSGKRIYSAKRLPPASDSSPEPEKPSVSPARSTPSPTREAQSEPKVTVPTLPVLEFKEGTRSSWKFSREAPRLSLDSRAIVDAKGGLHPREIPTNKAAMLSTPENDGDKQRRSTSVIAKLMGLESLPSSDPQPVVQLRRSASESRVSRDLQLPPNCRLFDPNNFHLKPNTNVVYDITNAAVDNRFNNVKPSDPSEPPPKTPLPVKQRGTIALRKSFYDTADFFPEPKHTVSIGDIERRLRMRGINEPSKDLHTLKHILEALQLKGLLHSHRPNQSPIVVMKPVRSFGSVNRTGNDSPPPPSSLRLNSPRGRRSPSPGNESRRGERAESDRNMRSEGRGRNLSPNRRKVEPQRRVSSEGGVDSRRVSPVHSPKVSGRRNGAVQQVTNGSPRMRKVIDRKEKMLSLGGAEDESSTVSENSFSTSSHPDTERYRLEEYKEGKELLDRCDKLLNSIAEITAASELQPSPVSVLDSSFYKDEWCSPSPITKRCIDYKDQGAESEDDMWSAALCSSEEAASEDCDFVYVSEILRACSYLPEESDIFLLLEKQQSIKGKDTSRGSMLQRRLIFDTLQEIIYRNQQLPPWKAALCGEQRQRIWSEFRRIREREECDSEDLFKVICGVLRKDMAEEVSGWGEWPVEMGDIVLDIERQVFKDLVGETIQELASYSPTCNKLSAYRRKLVF
ncbi:hypothetical protein RJT34_22615 [Clitoria ternatea]|uniref:DUF4378 domain-containing protein n=1 Tax=Clitoria ternatea TaxID=43366 RepID=A0AAN9IHM9_CLITE